MHAQSTETETGGAGPGPSGLIVIDKGLRATSMDVCATVRARLRRGGAPKRVKVGHAGTLDPLATGIVVVLVGKATRLCDKLMATHKRYIAEIDLSRQSPTHDLERVAEPVEVKRVPTRDEVEAMLARFTGWIMQVPPIFSALHVDGKRAYSLARDGKPVDLPPRPIHIHSIALIGYAFPLLTIDVSCGKGTYIRSLARDIGAALETGGVLTALRRTEVGVFGLEMAKRFDELPDPMTGAELLDHTRFTVDEEE